MRFNHLLSSLHHVHFSVDLIMIDRKLLVSLFSVMAQIWLMSDDQSRVSFRNQST